MRATHILLTGAGGQVGRAVRALAPSHVALSAFAHAELDITDARQVRAMVRSLRPRWIVNAAAYTDVERAESEPAAAQAINASAVGLLADAAREVQARLIHLSTDYVFDGRASAPYGPLDSPAPLNVYGASKLAGEALATCAEATAIVIRSSWVYAAHGKNFVRTMLQRMGLGEPVRVVCDQLGSPTWAHSLAALIWRSIEIDMAGGLCHWCDAGVASWYDFAIAIQEESLARGLLKQSVDIVPVRTAEYPARARRPAYSVLDCAHTRAVSGLPAIHWRAQLRKALDELVHS